MIRIQVRPNEPLESALRRFKRQCNYAGIFRLAKKYNYFEKKSDRERRERRERIRTMQRAQRRAMGPTKVRRTARKSKFKRGDKGGDSAEVADATAQALEQKGKELRLKGEAAPTTPASASDVAAAIGANVGAASPAVVPSSVTPPPVTPPPAVPSSAVPTTAAPAATTSETASIPQPAPAPAADSAE